MVNVSLLPIKLQREHMITIVNDTFDSGLGQVDLINKNNRKFCLSITKHNQMEKLARIQELINLQTSLKDQLIKNLHDGLAYFDVLINAAAVDTVFCVINDVQAFRDKNWIDKFKNLYITLLL